MTMDDEKFEQQLRSFRPREVRSLQVDRRRRIAVIVTAALAACVVFGVFAVRLSRTKPRIERMAVAIPAAQRRPVTLMDFNAALRADRLDDALELSAAQSLPRTNRPNTALNVLAKE